MVTTVYFDTEINSAHFLPGMPDGHKCRRMHGHTYRIRIEVTGPVGDDGMVIEYERVRAAWRPFFEMLDHRVLNEVAGLENPTCEKIGEWIMCGMAVSLKPLGVAVSIGETGQCGASVRFGAAP